MKIFVAGATGALGRRLVPLLVSNGHTVVGTTRTPSKAEALRAAGATPAILDALDRDAVIDALTRAEPEVVVHQLTALAGFTDFRKLDESFTATNRLRTEATDHLLEGIRRLPVRRIVAQSYAGPGFYARTGGPIKTEDDPFDPNPPAALRRTVEAIRYLERAVLKTEGVQGTVLRYGGFYGPGTSAGEGGSQLEAVRHRQFPTVAGGTGVWSFIHIDDAATATLAAIESGRTGVYNIVDDDPAPVAEWLPVLAAAVGAKAPPARPRLAGSPVRRRARGGHDDRVPRRLQRQGQAGAWLAAGLPELADRLPGGAGQLRGHQGGLSRSQASCTASSAERAEIR
jgi:2-alkyl-3-oxoalkanoate reductase